MQNKLIFFVLMIASSIAHAALFRLHEVDPAQWSVVDGKNSPVCDSDIQIANDSDVTEYDCIDDERRQIRYKGRTVFRSENLKTATLVDGRGVFVANKKIYVLREKDVYRIDNCLNPEIAPASSAGYVLRTPLLVRCGGRWYFFDSIHSVKKQSEWTDISWQGRGFVSFGKKTGWDVVDFHGNKVMSSSRKVLFASEAGYVDTANSWLVCAHTWVDPLKKQCSLKYKISNRGEDGYLFFVIGVDKYYDPLYSFEFSARYFSQLDGLYLIKDSEVDHLYTRTWTKLVSSKRVNIVESGLVNGKICSHIETDKGDGVICEDKIVVPFVFSSIFIGDGGFYCKDGNLNRKCF